MTDQQSTPDTLSLREAAEQLDVHYMTAYRYVRLGMLPASQEGRTWVVRVQDLEDFRASPSSASDRGAADWEARLFARMVDGDTSGAWAVTEAALASGMTPKAAYEDLLVTALSEVGNKWIAGEVDIAQEHAASQVATRIVGRLAPQMARRGVPRGTVVLGSTRTELHTLPASLAADLIRHAGFRVIELGVNLPPGSFARSLLAQPDALAAAISVTMSGQEGEVADTVSAIREVSGVPVIVGGAGISAGDALKAGADDYARSAGDAIAILEKLRDARSDA
mgnify:CR=1 FL=1